MILFFIFLWVLYACFEGIREGFYFHNRAFSSKQDSTEIYPLFFVQRSLLLLAFFVPINLGYTLNIALLFTLGLVLIFPFFHNAMYFSTRNNLDRNIFVKRWRDSTSSQGGIETNLFLRTIFLFAGAAVLLYCFKQPLI